MAMALSRTDRFRAWAAVMHRSTWEVTQTPAIAPDAAEAARSPHRGFSTVDTPSSIIVVGAIDTQSAPPPAYNLWRGGSADRPAPTRFATIQSG